ncbi:eukaryotic translation initiation factor 4 gamma 1-like isoform X1, partial [Leptotrombidium deliense]
MFAGQILQPIYSSNDALIDLIEQSFKSKKNETDPNFVSAFVKAVVQGCIYCTEVNGDTFYKVDSKRLESKCAVIAKYCYDDKEKEAKCLYALQQLAEELEHPSKLLSTIFTTLHDQNVISSEAFLQWESTNTM